MRGLDDGVHEWLGRVEIVAVHADIALAALAALDGEPVDEGLVGVVVQAAQHRAPGLERELAAVGERARHALDAAALARIELVGLALELGAQRLAEPSYRDQHLLEQVGQRIRRLDQAGVERADVAFLAEALVLARGARADLDAHQRQELLGRADHRTVGQTRLPVGRGQAPGKIEQPAQRVVRLFIFAQEIADAPFQPARSAPSAPLGTKNPTPQVRAFDAAQVRTERTVGGVEQMMAFVEHVAQRARGVVEPAHRRLHHDQRMVGDHDVGGARAADGALDEAFPVMLAGRVDALAAPVGQARDAAAAQEVHQPRRQVAADHVAVAAGQRPARQQAQADRVLGDQAGAHDGLLEVQQAEIVLAAFADHDAATLLGGVAEQPVHLVVDLALQVARVGGDPDRRAVLLRPQRGGRDIAQRLADAGAGLDQHDLGLVLDFSWGKRFGCRRRVIALRGACLGHVGARGDELGEAQARFARIDGLGAGRRGGRRLFPGRQALPHVEARPCTRLLRGIGIDAERGQHILAPRPVAARHGERQVLEVGRGEGGHIVELAQQRAGRFGESDQLILGRGGQRQIECLAEAAHRGQAEGRGTHEGVKFQQVAGRQRIEAEPRRGRGPMADQREACARAQGGFGRRESLDLAVRRQPQRPARRGKEGGSGAGHVVLRFPPLPASPPSGGEEQEREAPSFMFLAPARGRG